MSISSILPDRFAAGSSSEAMKNVALPIRVRYDITILGYAYVHGSTGKTGIHRVVEELASHLDASAQCQLSFCAMDCLPEVRRYLAETNRWSVQKPADIPDYPSLRTMLEAVNSGISHGPSALRLPYRATRRGMHRLYRHLTGADYPQFPMGDLSEVDVFHTASSGVPPSLKRHRGLACFQTVYDLIPVLFDDVVQEHQKRLLAATLRALRQDSWGLAVSEHTKNDLCDYTGMNPARVFVTPLAADRVRFYPCTDTARVDDVRARYGIPLGRYVLSVCTLEPRKNLERLVRCFARAALEPDMEDCTLVLTGNKGWGYEKINTILADMPALQNRIIFAGYVADEDLAPLYSSATAFAYPSLYEGFGLPPLEAMQCGTPVLTSNTSSLPEVVGDAGIMVGPRDEDALTQGILDLCRNEALRTDLSARSVARAAQFSWERCAAQTLDAYAQALASHSSASK